MLPHVGVIAMFGALMPGVVGDLTCAVQGMAYSQDNMAKTPNGAFLATPDMCQSSCSLTVYCQYFTWYNDSHACWLFGNQAKLVAFHNATSGPRVCAGGTASASVAAVTIAPPVVPSVTAPSPTLAPVTMSNASKQKEEYEKLVKKISKMASVIKDKTEDPEVRANADKVIASAAVETLPDVDTVYSVLNEVTATVPLEEAEKEGLVVYQDDLDAIVSKVPRQWHDSQHQAQYGALEAPESGVSYGAGRPWTNGVMPYCFDRSLNPRMVKYVQQAMSIIQNGVRGTANRGVPGIHFKNVGTNGGRCQESPSVFITDAQQGCFADMGMMTQFLGGSQKLNVPHTCSLGTVVHELLHVLGMGHEQARPDRDDYVTVHWQNIKSGMASQFEKKPSADTARPYDVGSIMHYSGLSFSNGRGPSMTPTRRGQSDLYASGLRKMGQREGISRLDWEQLVHLYNCRQDNRGRYSECSPEAAGPDLLIILLGVFGGVAACGCIGFVAYWFGCRGKNQRKIACQEVRPLMPARR